MFTSTWDHGDPTLFSGFASRDKVGATRGGAKKVAKLVTITPMGLWFMVYLNCGFETKLQLRGHHLAVDKLVHI